MLLHQRANYADQKQWPQEINMHVTTSQFEISSKNHIWSVKTFPPEHNYPSEKKKKLLEQAAFWHEVKVVCCLPTPFFTLWTWLPRSTCFKGGFHSHVSAESSQNRKGLGWNGTMEHSENHSGKRQIKHTLMQEGDNFIHPWSLIMSYLRLNLFQASVSCLTSWSHFRIIRWESQQSWVVISSVTLISGIFRRASVVTQEV